MALDEDNLPEGIQRELKGMFEPRGAFPAGRDAEILRKAMRGRRGWQVRRWVMSGAVAAAVAAMVGGLWYVQWGRGGVPTSASYVRTGDVRDAYFVARELKKHRSLSAAWDANHDGVVDEKDVQTLALAAVKVEGGVR